MVRKFSRGICALEWKRKRYVLELPSRKNILIESADLAERLASDKFTLNKQNFSNLESFLKPFYQLSFGMSGIAKFSVYMSQVRA